MTKVPDKRVISGLFDYRNGFAGKHGFIDLQSVRRENGAVCCDLVTGSKVEFVPHTDLFHWDFFQSVSSAPVGFGGSNDRKPVNDLLTRSSCTIPIRELAITTPIKSIFLYWPDKIIRPASAKFKKLK